ncbi:MAG TPA: glycosyltransferase [Solirubrobacteraceae bacterium]|nr:glycosyltransferase [Solirubrobacteraceae bacterium]
MRALVVSNMLADGGHPERGRFVRDQVEALRRLGDWQVDLYEFPPGSGALLGAAGHLRRRYSGERFDVVHAHFGLTAWPALAVRARGRALTVHGTDVRHPRTRMATRAALPTVGLLAAVSQALVEQLPGRRARERAQVLPCGVDIERFRPIPRAQARADLGLDPQGRYVLFPADPARPEKRHDLAMALAAGSDAQLIALGGVDPQRVPLYVNASNAVLVPSEREGFGLAVLEALACDVPVLATPVGVHAQALEGLVGTLCQPFDLERWRLALAPHLADRDPRVAGRPRAERFSATRMAELVGSAWRSLVAEAG